MEELAPQDKRPKRDACQQRESGAGGSLSWLVRKTMDALRFYAQLEIRALEFMYYLEELSGISYPLFRCPNPDGVWLRLEDKAQINEWFEGNIRADECVPCTQLHWGLCTVRHLQVFGMVFCRALKMYLPVHFLPSLVFGWRNVTKSVSSIGAWITRSLIASCRSSAFLATYCMIFAFSLCTFRRLFQYDSVLWANIGGLLCGASLLWEDASRRGEIAVYCMPQASQIWARAAIKRRWIRERTNWEPIVFAVSLALLMYFHRHPTNRRVIRSGTTISILSGIFGS